AALDRAHAVRASVAGRERHAPRAARRPRGARRHARRLTVARSGARPAPWSGAADLLHRGGEVVGLGTDDDLHDPTRADDAERAVLTEGVLVDESRVGDLDTQPRDARLQVHDVV